MPRSRWLIAAAVVAVLVVVAAGVVGWRRHPSSDDLVSGATGRGRGGTSTTQAPKGLQRGANGVGDTYYPNLGNGGYDVSHYQLDLRWDPAARRISGTTTITARATEDLSSFSLDLVGMDLFKVTVNGERADSFPEAGRDLRITPAGPLRDGATFTVAVTYGGAPHQVPGSDPGNPGWFGDADGDLFTAFEPDGAATFYPVNDHPSDKATYGFRITVPDRLTVVTNGRFVRKTPAGQ